MSGRLNKWYLYLLCLIVVGLGGSMLLLPAKTFSSEENRTLASFPAASWESIRSGEFGEALEQYAADQFPLREQWVTLKAWLEVGMNKKENNDVYAGRDGYLLQKLPEEPAIPLTTQITYLNQLADRIGGIPLHLMLVPSSAAILSGKLPQFAPVPDQRRYIEEAYRLLAGQAVDGVDSYEALQSHKDQYIYYRTDHHWTTLGAYYAYRELANSMGFTPLDLDDYRIDRISDRFYGTLTTKSKYRHVEPDAIDIWLPKANYSHKVTHMDNGGTMDSLYDWEKLNNRDQYPVFLGGNHALSIIETPEAPDKTLLLIKDSYAHEMVPFLAQHYRHIHMVDLRYLNISMKKYASEIGADEVLMLYNVATFQSDDQLVKLGW